jgi:hypothetical protein
VDAGAESQRGRMPDPPEGSLYQSDLVSSRVALIATLVSMALVQVALRSRLGSVVRTNSRHALLLVR